MISHVFWDFFSYRTRCKFTYHENVITYCHEIAFIENIKNIKLIRNFIHTKGLIILYINLGFEICQNLSVAIFGRFFIFRFG
jgi:hypothetical protein